MQLDPAFSAAALVVAVGRRRSGEERTRRRLVRKSDGAAPDHTGAALPGKTSHAVV